MQKLTNDKSRIFVLSLVVILASVFAWAVVVLVKEDRLWYLKEPSTRALKRRPPRGPGVPPAPHRTFEARLSDGALVSDARTRHTTSSGWRIYDQQGRQVGEIGGGGTAQFRDGLAAILDSPEPVGSTLTLEWEISRLLDKRNHPLGKLPDAEFTIVKYWVKSCKICQAHDLQEAQALQATLPAYDNVAINILDVDADIPKRPDVLANK